MKKSLTPNRFNFTTYTYNFLQTLTWIETTTKNEVFIVHLDLGGRCGEGDGWQRWFSDICLPCLNWVTFSLSWRRPICWSFICTHQVKFVLPLKGHVRICSDKNHKSLDKVIHKNSAMQSPTTAGKWHGQFNRLSYYIRSSNTPGVNTVRIQQ